MAANSPAASPGDRSSSADAAILRLDRADSIPELLSRSGVPHPRPVVVVIGWAAAVLSPEVQDSLDLLLLNALVPYCRDSGAIIVSGGTDVGVMAAVGRVAARVGGCNLVGVAPGRMLIGVDAGPNDPDAALPEPHHTVIATPGAKWGDERSYLVRIAEELAGGCGIAVVAIGGNDGTYGELEMAARRGWPILLVETGLDHKGNSASDVVALALAPQAVAGGRRPPELGSRELLRAGQRAAWNALVTAEERDLLRRVGIADHASLARVLAWRFSQDEVLKDAWRRYSRADSASVHNKRPIHVLAGWVTGLALVTAVLAGSRATIVTAATDVGWPTDGLATAIKIIVTGLPLVAVVLLGLMERLSRARPWIDQRSAAEAILGEIYRFRAEAPPYDGNSDPQTPNPNPSKVLASTLKAIEGQSDGRVFQSHGGETPSPAWPPSGACARVPGADPLVGPLSGAVYDGARVLNQIDYHDGTAGKQDRSALRIAGLVFTLSAATTLALTLSWAWELFSGVAAAFAAGIAAAVAWRAFQQRDGIAAMSLSTIVLLRHARADWLAIPADERHAPGALAAYVGEVEDTLGSERSEWQRSMLKAQEGYIAQAKLNEAWPTSPSDDRARRSRG